MIKSLKACLPFIIFLFLDMLSFKILASLFLDLWVYICIIWLVIVVIRKIYQLIKKKVTWKSAIWSIALPLITLVLILTHHSLQYSIALSKAETIAGYCKSFHKSKNRYPKNLEELQSIYPNDFSSWAGIPFISSKFGYSYFENKMFGSEYDSPTISWPLQPPFGTVYYDVKDTTRLTSLDTFGTPHVIHLMIRNRYLNKKKTRKEAA